ncbi:methyltransferase type 12 [Achromobacter piechaudii]|uniref:class I SAM-dependent methyltransferase n=1 Tax=Achromobacter piechaudii TaxID=72556 RepID=UPI0006812325|nr:class I SAM-dependent methyltransferase [Achromobacter piechaudii]KNY10935.1 methyltransferase type 12 [Achromobacter piechaudii]
MAVVGVDHFEALYRQHPDPWRISSAWYERRKRALLLASLGQERYRHAFEPGCGNGDLTLPLAARCERVCAVDFAGTALGRCRARLDEQGIDHVEALALDLPNEWPSVPQAGYDLIVVSELGYYLDDPALAAFLAGIDESLAEGGELVACHLRPDFDDRKQATDTLHQALGSLPGMAPLFNHQEAAFLLTGWRRNMKDEP